MTLRGPKGPRRGAELDELEVIPDGALLLRNGVIEEVGPSRRVENLASARGAFEINATGRVVMPGFVDSHTHLIYPPRGDHGFGYDPIFIANGMEQTFAEIDPMKNHAMSHRAKAFEKLLHSGIFAESF